MSRNMDVETTTRKRIRSLPQMNAIAGRSTTQPVKAIYSITIELLSRGNETVINFIALIRLLEIEKQAASVHCSCH